VDAGLHDERGEEGLFVAAGQTALLGLAAPDERAGVAGVQNQQLFALNGRDELIELLRAQGAFVFSVAKEQIDLPVVRGG